MCRHCVNARGVRGNVYSMACTVLRLIHNTLWMKQPMELSFWPLFQYFCLHITSFYFVNPSTIANQDCHTLAIIP